MDHQHRQRPAFTAYRRSSSIRLKIPLLDLEELQRACDDVSVLEEGGCDDGSSIYSEEELPPRQIESHRSASQRTSWSESTFNTLNSIIDIAVEPPRELRESWRSDAEGFPPSHHNSATRRPSPVDTSDRTMKRRNRPHARDVRLSQSIVSNSDSRVHLEPAEIMLDLDMKVMHQNCELRAELARLKNELRDKDEELKKREGRRRSVDSASRIVSSLWKKVTKGKRKHQPTNISKNGRVEGVTGKPQNFTMSHNSFGTEATVGNDEDSLCPSFMIIKP